jgi:hypothetical protein
MIVFKDSIRTNNRGIRKEKDFDDTYGEFFTIKGDKSKTPYFHSENSIINMHMLELLDEVEFVVDILKGRTCLVDEDATEIFKMLCSEHCLI